MSQSLVAALEAVGVARRFATGHLCSWGLDQVVCLAGARGEEKVCLGEAVELVVDELVANSITATLRNMPTSNDDAPASDLAVVEVQLRHTCTRLLCEVWDSSDGTPVASDAGLDDESGRGLLLVNCYAAGWECRPSPCGVGKVTAAWWDLTDPFSRAG